MDSSQGNDIKHTSVNGGLRAKVQKHAKHEEEMPEVICRDGSMFKPV